jgi:hypothetical protein
MAGFREGGRRGPRSRAEQEAEWASLPDSRECATTKCGFQFEGVLRQALFHGGQYKDLQLYSIVRSESRPLRELLG